MKSNNDSNFAGSERERELDETLTEMNFRVKSFLEKDDAGCVIWKWNAIAAKPVGRVWERQIRSAKIILSQLLITYCKNLYDRSL